MNESHVETLIKARDLLVGHRRALARILSTANDGRGFDARAKFVDIQATIEAMDRALKEEKDLQAIAPHLS